MLAIAGVLPVYLAYLGCAAAAAFIASVVTGCDNGKPHTTDPDEDVDAGGDDLPPADDDAPGIDDDGAQPDPDIVDDDIVDDDQVDVEEDDDGIVDPDDDLIDTDLPDDDAIDTDLPDDDIDADTDTDADDVACTPRTGFNPCAASFSGPIRDLDAIAGGVTAFGGAVPSIFRCATSGLGAASCELKAVLPGTGLEASQYHSTPFGSAIATTTPIRIFRVDETAWMAEGPINPNPITIGSGSDSVLFDLVRSGGIAAVETTEVPTERFFVGFDATSDGASTGLVGAFANVDGNWANLRSPGFPKGLNTTGMGATTLDLGSGDREYVVAMNAGKIDATDAFEAGIAIFDPAASSLLRVKLCELGEVELAAIPEIAFDATGRKAYVVVASPSPALKRIHLETCAEEMNLAIAANLGGAVVDLVVDGSKAYLADAGGRILVVDVATPAVLGSVALADAPTACAMGGAHLYCAAGTHLVAIDPATVELE